MSASIFKRAKTGGWFPELPTQLFIAGLPMPLDGLACIELLDRRIGSQGWDNAPGDLAECFAHHDGIEKSRADLKRRESAELKKAGARLRRITIENYRAP